MVSRFADVVGDDFDNPSGGDYEILGAYHVLADAGASPESRAAASRALTRPEPEAPTERALGGLTAYPRAALPLGSAVVLTPGEVRQVEFHPQRPMRGPYWLGLSEGRGLKVRGLTFGNECAFLSVGDVPGEFFDVSDGLEHLVAIAGATLNLGSRVMLELRNVSCLTIETTVCLWGNTAETLGMREPAGSAGLRARVAELEAVAKRWEQSSADLLAKLERERCIEAESLRDRELTIPAVAAERDRRVEHEKRKAADVAASVAHVAREPFDSDVWESPTDES